MQRDEFYCVCDFVKQFLGELLSIISLYFLLEHCHVRVDVSQEMDTFFHSCLSKLN